MYKERLFVPFDTQLILTLKGERPLKLAVALFSSRIIDGKTLVTLTCKVSL